MRLQWLLWLGHQTSSVSPVTAARPRRSFTAFPRAHGSGQPTHAHASAHECRGASTVERLLALDASVVRCENLLFPLLLWLPPSGPFVSKWLA